MHFSALPSILIVSVLPTLTSATCYKTGLQFGELRGRFDKKADLDTVNAMVDTFCGRVDGTVYYPDTNSWKACANTDVVRGVGENAICGQNCRDSCSFIGAGGRGSGEMAQGLCAANCPDCPQETGETNHIAFEISLAAKEAMTADRDACKAAMNTEISVCGRGSDQVHDGFWYRIDPEIGACKGSDGEVL